MSMSPGSTLMPSVSIVGVPGGIVISEREPTATIRSPAISTTPFWIGGPS
jgi:hypothetical protein